jgi:hypothetical protein
MVSSAVLGKRFPDEMWYMYTRSYKFLPLPVEARITGSLAVLLVPVLTDKGRFEGISDA